MPYKYGAVIESLTYIYILVLSRTLLGEKLTRRKVTGMFMIVAGVIVFSLGG
jgi:drug/metabolite transporter (DMT)-like permease